MQMWFASIGLALALGVGVRVPQQTVEAGTELQIRLRQLVSSHSSKRGAEVRAFVIRPVVRGGATVIPLGSELAGYVAAVRRVGLGFARERAYVEIIFNRLRLPDGQELPVDLKITRVDDARETVDQNGRVHGIRATSSFASMVSGMAVSAGFVDPMLLGFTMSSSLSAFRIPESEVIFPAGTELRAALQAPLQIQAAFDPLVPDYLADGPRRADLREAVRGLPFRTATELGGVPSDVTNLVFLGSRDAVASAFDAAGWGQTDTLNVRSSYMALRAIVENQGYREAPMSTLLLDARRPAFTYAKTLNTFFERHHLRIFGDVGEFDGVPLWTSSSTHDSGIGFATQRKTFIHVIDENIDEERDKVVHDLILTGCVDAVTYVDRPWLPDDLSNSTGDTLRTDKRIAVLRLNGCERASRADEDISASVLDGEPDERPNIVARGMRNFLLTMKNDFWRGNILYQGYSLVKMGVGALAGRGAPPPPEGRAVEFAGERFKVVPGAEAHREALAPEVHFRAPTYDAPAQPPRYDPRLLFSFAATETRFAGDGFSTLGVTLPVDVPQFGTVNVPVDLVVGMRPERGFVARVTLRSWSRVSQEFSYTLNRTLFVTTLTNPLLEPTDVAARAQIRQFNYNLLVHALPNGRRIRPYAAFGPGMQLIRLNEAVAGTNSTLRFAFKDVSLLSSTWDFGSKPPLEGGGVFQFDFQYGGGVKLHLTPNLVLRADFRETISKQPDFWTKSYPSLAEIGVTPATYTTAGPLRHRLFSIGFGIGF